MTKLRYLLLFPVAIVVLNVVFIAGIYSLSLTAKLFCPAEFGAGHDCYAPYWPDVELGLRVFWAGAAAFLIVLVSWLLAPEKKIPIAIWAYAAGAIVATLAAMTTGEWYAWLSAIAAGGIAITIVYRSKLTLKKIRAANASA